MPQPIRPTESTAPARARLTIPTLPDFGKMRLEEAGSPYYFVLAYGTPILLPGDRTGRILKDLEISSEQYESIAGDTGRTDVRRIAGTNNKLAVIELSAESFPFIGDGHRDFVQYIKSPEYRKQLKKREGEIQGDPSKIRVLNPKDFDPINAARGLMYLRTNKAFVHKLKKPAPVA